MTESELRSWAESVTVDLIASHEKKIREGLIRDDLLESCANELGEAKSRYLAKEGVKSLPQPLRIFDSVFNDLVLAHSSHQPCPLW